MKLSAYGRTELARVRVTRRTDPTISGSNEVRTELVLLSDRTVGTRNIWLKDGKVDHATGWKVLGKMKDHLFAEGPDAWVERKSRQGYTRV